MYERESSDNPIPIHRARVVNNCVPFPDPVLFFEGVSTVYVQARTFGGGSLIADVLA